jgi:outer membrane immunogenic protein
MTRLLLIGAAFAALIAPAMAAEKPVRVYKRVRPVVVAAPVYSWTGFYVGMNAGDAWTHRSFTFTPNDPLIPLSIAANGGFPPQPVSIDSNRGTLGGQIGYNWQFAPRWLAGLEVDINSAALNGSAVSQFSTATNVGLIFSNVMTSEVKWFETARARLGYLLTDNLLLYGTGGLAYGRVNTNSQVFSNGVGASAQSVMGFSWRCVPATLPCWSGSSSRTTAGWTAGGGLEWAFLQNFTLRAEYLYVNLGNDSFNVVSVPAGILAPSSFKTISNDVTIQVVRVGLNYKFGDYYAPVVTK